MDNALGVDALVANALVVDTLVADVLREYASAATQEWGSPCTHPPCTRCAKVNVVWIRGEFQAWKKCFVILFIGLD